MDLRERGEGFAEFWRERHLSTLTTVRPDGTPHVVPVGVTLEAERGVARVTSHRGSLKARLIADLSPGSPDTSGAPVAVCQVDGRRWSTLEGRAVVLEDPESVAQAEKAYGERYRTPRENPERVVIEITVTRVKGSV